MISGISNWAQQIIIAVIIGTLIEMILPNGNNKKYIKTIIGIYILYTIISPVIKLAGGEIKLDYSDYEKYFNSSDNIEYGESISVNDTYKAELEKKLKKDVEDLGYSVYKSEIEFNLEDGVIEKATLILDKEKHNENRVEVSINKIEIGSSSTKESATDKEFQNIKDKIIADYGVDSKNIIITWR